jgi:hypothetical protein
MGCERGRSPVQVATRLRGRRESLCCGYRENRCRENWPDLTAFANSDGCVWGATTARRSSFSQLKLSVVQAKAIRVQRGCKLQGRRQRFPTVRTVVGLGNSEEVAKSANIRACTSTACCECLWTLGIRMMTLLKSSASRQEKASACNRNGAATDEHFCLSDGAARGRAGGGIFAFVELHAGVPICS